MNISDILKKIKSDFWPTKEEGIKELKSYLALYSNRTTPIRISFWEKIGNQQKQKFLIGVLEKFSLIRDRVGKERLYICLLISAKRDKGKFKTILKKKILLEDLIQIIPWGTSPGANLFKEEVSGEEKI